MKASSDRTSPGGPVPAPDRAERGAEEPTAAVALRPSALTLPARQAKAGGSTGQTEASQCAWRSGPQFGIEVGVWECTPGSFPSKRDGYSEICLIEEGEGSVTSADGSVVEFGPGTVLVFPEGWIGEWDITRAIRKTYVVVLANSSECATHQKGSA